MTPEQKLANLRARQKRYHERNREARNAKSNARHARKREEANRLRREHYQANRERSLAAAKVYGEANRERLVALRKAFHLEHPWKKTAANKKRKLTKQRATPPWADSEKINAIYAEAAFMRSLGVDVHVDHILPLKGKTVSGLHTHDNLQLLLAKDNLSKSNKVLPVSVSR
jgi:hypothetical protein